MILGAAAQAEGGLCGLDAVATAALRSWFLAEVPRMAQARADTGGGWDAASDAFKAANALNNLGAPEVALDLYDLAAAGFMVAGDAANAAFALTNGGIALARRGKHAEARPQFEAALAALTEEYGPADEKTQNTRVSLGNCMMDQREYAPARVELEAAAEGLEVAVGAVHTWTLVARENLAILLWRAGDHAAAHKQVVAAQSGRAAQALPLLEAAAPALAAQLGAEDPQASWAQGQLECVRQVLGR